MINRDSFSSYHPIINFLYFFLVLTFTMSFMHPICLGITLISAMLYSFYLGGKKAIRFSLYYMLPMVIMILLLNPAFNHEGITMLTYLPSGNPLTLESIVYGGASAIMLVSVIIWFTCFNEIITSDKFVYLFGKLAPALSLILSMTLRFIPKFTEQTKKVVEAQRCIGRDISLGSLFSRAKVGITIISIMITWSLEDAIETADSMKSRGYGLPGRTAFSNYRFDERDKTALIWLLFCGIYLFSGWIFGVFKFRYYPSIKGAEATAFNLSFMLVYLLLCLTPVILNVKGDREWKRLQ